MQPLATHVPQRDRVHARDAIEKLVAVLLVEMQDDFDVAVSAERVPGLEELRAQLAVVVDLAVADDPESFVFVRDGLMAAGEVDDRQPAHP